MSRLQIRPRSTGAAICQVRTRILGFARCGHSTLRICWNQGTHAPQRRALPFSRTRSNAGITRVVTPAAVSRVRRVLRSDAQRASASGTAPFRIQSFPLRARAVLSGWRNPNKYSGTGGASARRAGVLTGCEGASCVLARRVRRRAGDALTSNEGRRTTSILGRLSIARVRCADRSAPPRRAPPDRTALFVDSSERRMT